MRASLLPMRDPAAGVIPSRGTPMACRGRRAATREARCAPAGSLSGRRRTSAELVHAVAHMGLGPRSVARSRQSSPPREVNVYGELVLLEVEEVAVVDGVAVVLGAVLVGVGVAVLGVAVGVDRGVLDWRVDVGLGTVGVPGELEALLCPTCPFAACCCSSSPCPCRWRRRGHGPGADGRAVRRDLGFPSGRLRKVPGGHGARGLGTVPLMLRPGVAQTVGCRTGRVGAHAVRSSWSCPGLECWRRSAVPPARRWLRGRHSGDSAAGNRCTPRHPRWPVRWRIR